MNIISKIPEISEAVKAVEAAYPEGGKGAAKLEAVRGILETLDTAYKELWPKVQALVAVLVTLFNAVGLFKKRT